MNGNLQPHTQPSKTHILLVSGGAIAAYVVTMTVLYALTHKVVFTLTFTNTATATYVVIWRKRHTNSPLIAKSRKSWWRLLLNVLAAMVVTIGIYMGASTIALLVKNVLNAPSPIQNVTDEVPLAAIAVLSILIVPIGEEALMRGFIYPVLRRKLSVASTIVITALLFAILHGNLVQIVLTIPLGIALGYLYERTHNLLACISMHMLFNATALLLPSVHIGNLDAIAAALLVVITLGLWMCIPRIQAKRTADTLMNEL